MVGGTGGDTDRRSITHLSVPAGLPGEQPTTREVPVALDERDGSRVYVRQARPGEEGNSVQIEDDETVVLRAEASHFFFEGKGKLVRVVPEGREGSSVFYRRLDPGEADTGETVKFVPGEDNLVFVQRVTYVSLHFSPEVGRRDDLLTAMRLVPDGREGRTVYGRTLRPDEDDTGEGVILRPGDRLQLRPGALSISVEGIDAYGAAPRRTGMRP